jgi:hypothetical protein
LSAINGKMAWFGFVANATPISQTILVAMSSFFAVAANEVVI